MKLGQRLPLLERLKQRTIEAPAPVGVAADGPCWVWQGATDSGGYGQTTIGYASEGTKRAANVHRVGYEELVGSIPDGLVLDHLCRVRACWNPGHLEPVTYRVNNVRGEGFPGQNARKAQCQAGHDLTEAANVYRKPGRPNERCCRECRRIADVARQEVLKEKRQAAMASRQRPTTCKHGHDLTNPANCQIPPNHPEQRRCRVCSRERTRQYRQQKKGASAWASRTLPLEPPSCPPSPTPSTAN